ncbi:hypothetical protein [Crenothrix sp.]
MTDLPFKSPTRFVIPGLFLTGSFITELFGIAFIIASSCGRFTENLGIC